MQVLGFSEQAIALQQRFKSLLELAFEEIREFLEQGFVIGNVGF